MVVRLLTAEHGTGRARTTRRAARVASAIAAVCALAAPVRAQPGSRRPPASADSARVVADLFFRAVADERWEAAAAMLDTTAVRRLVTEQVRRPPERARREMTLDDFMRDDPRKPRAVAEYELERYREQAAKLDAGSMLSFEWFGVQSVDELRLLTAVQAGARYLQAQDIRVQVREEARRSGCGAANLTIPFSFRRILAAALASDTAAYVLYADDMFATRRDALVPPDPSVMQLRLRGDGWRIQPSRTLLGHMGFSFMSARCDSAARRPPG